jgi:hypothetical protein
MAADALEAVEARPIATMARRRILSEDFIMMGAGKGAVTDAPVR